MRRALSSLVARGLGAAALDTSSKRGVDALFASSTTMQQQHRLRASRGMAAVMPSVPRPTPTPLLLQQRHPLPLLRLPSAPTRAAASSTRSNSSTSSSSPGGNDEDEDVVTTYLRPAPHAPRPLAFRKWSVAKRAKAADPVSHHSGLRASLRTRGEVEVVLELPPDANSDGIGAALGAAAKSSSSSLPRGAEAERLAKRLADDAPAVLELAVRERALRAARLGERYVPPQVALASVVLTTDARMRELNLEHRAKDAPTDVLTLELRDAEVDRGRVRLPVRLMGDVIISLDTAARQARERGQEAEEAVVGGKRRQKRRQQQQKAAGGFGGKAGAPLAGSSSSSSYTLLDELRVLLVHGALHLVGMDHERSEEENEEMAAAERRTMQALGWKGEGLISGAEAQAAAKEDEEEEEEEGDDAASSSSSSSSSRAPPVFSSSTSSSRPRLVALDMDGTLLNAQSRIDPQSARAIRAAVEERGVRVVLATGKARPAALAAARAAGLDPLLCSEQGPGVFLQGLAVHGARGEPLSDACLPPGLVRSALLWARQHDVPLCCFLGDECAALGKPRAPELEELHARYYEPLAAEFDDADALLERAAAVGGARKLLFMTTAERVGKLVEPFWRRELAVAAVAMAGDHSSPPRPFGGLADVTIAVPEMLEVVPRGVNKWIGLQRLLGALSVDARDLMAVGDGLNDLEMVRGAGIGVAMGNAVPRVKEAADAVVRGHDEGGIVEAFEKFVL